MAILVLEVYETRIQVFDLVVNIRFSIYHYLYTRTAVHDLFISTSVPYHIASYICHV